MSLGIELHAFGFEQDSLNVLERRAALSLAYLALGVDHALPRHVGTFGNGGHGISHLARATWKTCHGGDGSVGRNATPWDLSYDSVVLFVGSHGATSLGRARPRRNTVVAEHDDHHQASIT